MLTRNVSNGSEALVHPNKSCRQDREEHPESEDNQVSDTDRKRRITSEERLFARVFVVSGWERAHIYSIDEVLPVDDSGHGGSVLFFLKMLAIKTVRTKIVRSLEQKNFVRPSTGTLAFVEGAKPPGRRFAAPLVPGLRRVS